MPPAAHGVTCGAPNSHGMPCRRAPMHGMTRCQLHGGANPAAKIKSEQMLAQARLPACEALFTILEDWQRDTCPSCGFPAANSVDNQKVIIRAAQVILDRSGLGPRATIETVTQTDGDLNLDLLTDNEMGLLDYHLAQIKELKETVRARLNMIPGVLPPALPAALPVIDVLPDDA